MKNVGMLRAGARGMKPRKAVVCVLSDPGCSPHAFARDRHLQTHISRAFLAGAHGDKRKKALGFSCRGFRAPERRHHFLSLLGVPHRLGRFRAIAVAANGRLCLGGSGRVVDQGRRNWRPQWSSCGLRRGTHE